MRVAMFISDDDTIAAAILQRCKEGKLPHVRPVLVIASRPEAGGIERISKMQIPGLSIAVIQRKKYTSDAAFGEAILEQCLIRDVHFVGQYGWREQTPTNVSRHYRGMIVNQFPGPRDPGRPDFSGEGMHGLAVHHARLAYVRAAHAEISTLNRRAYLENFYTEVTAHQVEDDIDGGALIDTITVPILPDDTVETLQRRALVEEHKLQVRVIDRFSRGYYVQPRVRKEPLVPERFYGILEAAKWEAINLYNRH